MMPRSLERTGALFLLLWSFGMYSVADAGVVKFTYTFKSGTMNCTDNFPKGVRCTNPPRGEHMNTGGFGDSRHSNIISFVGDKGSTNYALGFENATSGSHYLSIYSYDSSTGLAGPSIWYATDDNGVSVQAPGVPSLIFSADGNLELWSKGQLRWTVGTRGLGVTTLEFIVRSESKSEAGNLILYNKLHCAVWQTTETEEGTSFTLYTEFTPNFVCKNRPEGVMCSPPVGVDLNPSPGDNNHRNIISYNGNGKYAFGFEKTRGGFFLSIYRFNPSDNSAGRPIWRARSKSGSLVTVDENATITFGRGTIELKSSRGTPVWATGSRGSGYWLNFYFETGNLMLKSNQKAIVWESGWSRGISLDLPLRPGRAGIQYSV